MQYEMDGSDIATLERISALTGLPKAELKSYKWQAEVLNIQGMISQAHFTTAKDATQESVISLKELAEIDCGDPLSFLSSWFIAWVDIEEQDLIYDETDPLNFVFSLGKVIEMARDNADFCRHELPESFAGKSRMIQQADKFLSTLVTQHYIRGGYRK